MTTTPHAALLTDDEVAQRINLACTNLFDRAGTTSFRIARSIEQAILAKLQATQEPVQAGELPPLPFPNDHNGFGRCPDRYTADQMYAYARSALSARKPLTPLIARQLGEWHEDDGPVMWWAWNGHGWAGEPAWCGQPTDSDWPGYHTHWTPHPQQPATNGIGLEVKP